MDSPSSPRFLTIGVFSRPHGVRGELRLRPLTAFPDRIQDLKSIYVGRDQQDDTSLRLYDVTRARRDRGEWLISLAGIEDRDAADRFRGSYVLVTLEDAVPLAEDEIYLFQVIGLSVYTEEGLALGRVAEVIETGANDVYVVRGPLGEVLIPAIDQVVLKIDPDADQMIIRPLPGLLP
jgi:16S rRNA processing protein RimM